MEPHVRAQVVSAAPALIAATTCLTRLDGDAFAHPCGGDSFSDLHYLPGRFVPEDQGAPHDEVADSTVLVVVDVGPADSDRQDPDPYLALRWSRDWTLFDAQIMRRVKNGRRHRAGFGPGRRLHRDHSGGAHIRPRAGRRPR